MRKTFFSLFYRRKLIHDLKVVVICIYSFKEQSPVDNPQIQKIVRTRSSRHVSPLLGLISTAYRLTNSTELG